MQAEAQAMQEVVQTPLIYEFLRSAIPASVGAFAGAFAAFLLENRRRRRDETKERIRNGNLALYTLHLYWDRIEQYSKDVLRPNLDEPDLWINLPPAETGLGVGDLDTSDVSFLLATPHVNLYADFHMQKRRFGTFVRIVEKRDTIILSHVRPRMTEAGFVGGQKLDLKKIVDLIGEDTRVELDALTNAIFQHASKNQKEFQSAFYDLRGALGELNPKEKFISSDFGYINKDD